MTTLLSMRWPWPDPNPTGGVGVQSEAIKIDSKPSIPDARQSLFVNHY